MYGVQERSKEDWRGIVVKERKPMLVVLNEGNRGRLEDEENESEMEWRDMILGGMISSGFSGEHRARERRG